MDAPVACMYPEVVATLLCPIALDTFATEAPSLNEMEQNPCRNQCGDASGITCDIIRLTLRYACVLER